jgi:hypothetical protein
MAARHLRNLPANDGSLSGGDGRVEKGRDAQ